MPVSGLIITLRGDHPLQTETLSFLRERSCLTLGVRSGDRIAAVSETDSTAKDEEVWGWIRALPGVSHVDLVLVDFSDLKEFGEGRNVVSMRGRVSSPRGRSEYANTEVQ